MFHLPILTFRKRTSAADVGDGTDESTTYDAEVEDDDHVETVSAYIIGVRFWRMARNEKYKNCKNNEPTDFKMEI